MEYLFIEKGQEHDFWGFENKYVYVNENSFYEVNKKFEDYGLSLEFDALNSGPDVLELINIINTKYNYLIQEKLTMFKNKNINYNKTYFKNMYIIDDNGIIIKGLRLSVDEVSEIISLDEINITNTDKLTKNIDVSVIERTIEDLEETILNSQKRLINLKNIKNVL